MRSEGMKSEVQEHSWPIGDGTENMIMIVDGGLAGNRTSNSAMKNAIIRKIVKEA